MMGELIERSVLEKKPVTPYHIKWYDEVAWGNGVENRKVYVQKKYDGTHVQLSWYYGVRNHSGLTPNELTIRGLVLLEHTDDNFRELLDLLRKNEALVVTIELFGSKLTPAGYHKNWPKEFDFRVLDVYFLGKYLPPEMWLDIVPKPAYTEVYTPDELTLDVLKKLALSPEWYEGVVLKQYGDEFAGDVYYVGHGLRIAKFKPKELVKVPQRFSKGKRSALFVEVVDELKKGNMEKNRIIDYLYAAHPELVKKYKIEYLKGVVEQIIKWYKYARQE